MLSSTNPDTLNAIMFGQLIIQHAIARGCNGELGADKGLLVIGEAV